MFKLKHILLLLLSVILFTQTYSQKKTQITGVYTNLEYVKESGDVVGMEVIIVYSTDGKNGQHYALVQEAQGLPSQPILVQVKVDKDGIEFSLSDKQVFRGKISKKELVGKFVGNENIIKLKRKKSYWQ